MSAERLRESDRIMREPLCADCDAPAVIEQDAPVNRRVTCETWPGCVRGFAWGRFRRWRAKNSGTVADYVAHLTRGRS